MEQTLSVAEQRRALNSFLEEADDEKVKRLYGVLVSGFLDEASPSETEVAQWEELQRRREAYLRGEMKGHPWREVMQRLKERQSLSE